MSSLPKWLLLCGFLTGYLVLLGVHWVMAPSGPFGLEAFLVSSTTYVGLIGGSLLVPWVIIPVIAIQSRRSKRVIIAVLASLLPAVVAIGGLTGLFLGWDVPPTMQVGLCLWIAAWCVPAIGALAYTAAFGTDMFAHESKSTNPIVVAAACIVAPIVVAVFAMFVLVVAGWVTRTESPTTEQVAHAREYLLIEPGLEIEPLAYYLKDGMDYMVRFKFIAKTHDPTRIFNSSRIDHSILRANFDFPSGEESHNEPWWNISSRALVGGRVPAPHGHTLVIGFTKNDDKTFTVYAWRHE